MTTSKTSLFVGAALVLGLLGSGGGFLAGNAKAKALAQETSALKIRIAEGVQSGAIPHTPSLLSRSVGEAGQSVSQIMERALALLRSEDRLDQRRASLELQKLKSEDIGEALPYLESARAEERVFVSMAHHLLPLWAETNGEAAMSYVLENLEGMAFEKTAVQTIKVWAKWEPTLAWEWNQNALAESPTELKKFVSLSGEILTRWVTRDFEKGVEMMTAVSDAYFEDFQRDLASRVAANDEREVLLRAVDAVDTEVRLREIATEINRRWGEPEPVEAARWFEALTFEDEASRWRAGSELGEEWMEADREAALTWLWKEFSNRRSELDPLLRQWRNEDPSAVERWLKDRED